MALVGRHASNLTVMFLETIKKPLQLNRPGMFPTSSQTKGATESVWRLTVMEASLCCTLACRDSNAVSEAFGFTANKINQSAVRSHLPMEAAENLQI